ncbi:MAG TPA: hypothetical protein VM285_17310 [Polyangia bacterium]|nr:hypothetical protein [Polyangia bacterium]
MSPFLAELLCAEGLGHLLRHHHQQGGDLEVADELVELGNDPIEVAEFLEDERAWRDLDEEKQCRCSDMKTR